MDWKTEIDCEGGPIMVANYSDFLQWTGSNPFPDSKHSQLLYYSPFSGELPAAFSKYGTNGHIFIDSESPASTRDELISTCMKLFPGSNIDQRDSTWVLTRPDGKKLFASLQPSSEYDASIANFQHDKRYSYGHDASCFLWSAEPGLVLVDISNNNTTLLLAQVYFADSDLDVENAYNFALSNKSTNPAGTTYEIKNGPVIAMWSPQAASDLSTDFNLSSIGANIPGLKLDLVTSSSGAAFWMEPGIYTSHLGDHESDTWGISWCILSIDT